LSRNGEEQDFDSVNVVDLLKHPKYNSAKKLVIFIYAVLPESTSMFTKYADNLKEVKKAYRSVDDNFIYLDLESVLKDAGIVSSNIF
jgi:hypothetical protein